MIDHSFSQNNTSLRNFVLSSVLLDIIDAKYPQELEGSGCEKSQLVAAKIKINLSIGPS
ncbi:hypothetical protein ACE4RR_19865 [Alteribacillus sp. HJP-4]